MHAALREPRLWDCTLQSILQTLMLVAELDISVTGHNNGAYFEVRKCKVGKGQNERWEQRLGLGLGYNALITLIMRDGMVTSCSTGVVRQGDEFEYDEGTSAFIRHKRAIPGDPDAPAVAFYAYARMRTGEYKIEIMPAWEVREIRRKHAHEKSAAWNGSFDETGRKTPLRRMFKTMPTSVRLAAALEEFDQGHRLANDEERQETSQDGQGLNARIMGARAAGGQETAQDGPGATDGSMPAPNPPEANGRALPPADPMPRLDFRQREQTPISHDDIDAAFSGSGRSEPPEIDENDIPF